MLVYVGDWVKIAGVWRQVVDVGNDLFALIHSDLDGGLEWYDTRKRIDGLTHHVAHPTMQDKLQEAGL
jgi:hypothetical protein